MELFDEVIEDINHQINQANTKSLRIRDDITWEDKGNNNMVLRSDMAYELGSTQSGSYAIGGTAYTACDSLVASDEIILIGDDLSDIHADTSYARIAICLVDSEAMGEGNKLYNAIRKIEYTRYHVNPEGFMIRVSSVNDRECVRVSKEAIDRGMDFETVGNLMIDEFKKNSRVLAVKLIFITDPAFDYESLQKTVKKSELITRTIDHILNNANMDCDTCNLSEICDEVEGMRELHQAQSSSAN